MVNCNGKRPLMFSFNNNSTDCIAVMQFFVALILLFVSFLLYLYRSSIDFLWSSCLFSSFNLFISFLAQIRVIFSLMFMFLFFLFILASFLFLTFSFVFFILLLLLLFFLFFSLSIFVFFFNPVFFIGSCHFFLHVFLVFFLLSLCCLYL